MPLSTDLITMRLANADRLSYTPVMAETLHDLVTARKMIATSADWTSSGRRLSLKLPLAIDGLIEEGLFLRGSSLSHIPDREVVLQLEYHGVRIPGGTGPLCRAEWNPMRPHNNKGKGPKELRFEEQMLSHVHLFEDNWDDIAGALFPDNLPIARPIIAELSHFIDFRDYVGLKFGIMNIDLVKTPEWEYVLDLGSE